MQWNGRKYAYFYQKIGLLNIYEVRDILVKRRYITEEVTGNKCVNCKEDRHTADTYEILLLFCMKTMLLIAPIHPFAHTQLQHID